MEWNRIESWVIVDTSLDWVPHGVREDKVFHRVDVCVSMADAEAAMSDELLMAGGNTRREGRKRDG